MSENEKRPPEEISVKEAVKLKHAINKGILYGGMNAKEFKEFKRINADQWKKIREDYFKCGTWLFNKKVLFVFLILACAAYFFFSGWPRTIAAVVGILCFIAIIKREGHSEGYIDGYQDGFDEGINKALGIDEKEASDIYERAREMEIDDRIVSKWEEEDQQKNND